MGGFRHSSGSGLLVSMELSWLSHILWFVICFRGFFFPASNATSGVLTLCSAQTLIIESSRPLWNWFQSDILVSS